ncbi:MAG TPA: hypothetical protein VLX29_04905 [Nitrospirota bacterium]|nr:hypothetical protein [Nitrospirota bacterium]
MASKLIITNLSRHFNYTILLNGHESGGVFPLQTTSLTIEPGKHELSFKDSDADNLPTHCKPIQITIADGKTLNLKVLTEDFSIRIYDEQGTHLNGKRGFLCGQISDGIHIENPIS